MTLKWPGSRSGTVSAAVTLAAVERTNVAMPSENTQAVMTE
jgi:hypothetical protein